MEIAATYHAERNVTRNVDTLDAALRVYTAYVTAFPSDAVRGAAFAEALWSRAVLETDPKKRAQRWDAAASVFAGLWTFDGDHAAALAWLDMLDFVAPTTATVTVRSLAKAARPLPLSPRDARLVTGLTAYVTHATTAQPGAAPALVNIVLARLAVAVTLRRYRHFEEATDVLDQLLADHPTDPSAEVAAMLMLDSMVQAKDPDMPVVVSAMLADRAFVDTKPQLVKALSQLRRTR